MYLALEEWTCIHKLVISYVCFTSRISVLNCDVQHTKKNDSTHLFIIWLVFNGVLQDITPRLARAGLELFDHIGDRLPLCLCQGKLADYIYISYLEWLCETSLKLSISSQLPWKLVRNSLNGILHIPINRKCKVFI